MLNKRYRISEKKDFENVYSLGKKIKGQYGMLIGLEDKDIANCKFGVVVGKKIGKAHQRNKLKRWFRNIVQRLLNEGFFKDNSLKVTYIAFKKPEDFKSFEQELLEQFRKLFEK